MLARLWWKEYRAFGPVWLILVLAAGLLQWLFLAVDSSSWRDGSLTQAALLWAVLYAFAAGAAAFAGERESRSMAFLDALPVERRMLWLGKVSFALVSTFGLAFVLGGLAELGTESRSPLERHAYPEVAFVFGTILFEAVAWSLLASSLASNPLVAGGLGVVSVYISALTCENLAATGHLLASNDLVSPNAILARVMVALAALAVSGLVMSWGHGSKTRRVRVPRPSTGPTPPAIQASSVGRSLGWQAIREGWTIWVLAVVLSVLSSRTNRANSPIDLGPDLILATLASLVAGVSVFGVENAQGSRRFLVQHGVAPGTVWWCKLLVWAPAMGIVLSLMGFLYLNGLSPDEQRNPNSYSSERLSLLAVGAVDAFSVGLLVGMTIRRRITATLVGVITLVGLVPIQAALVINALVPWWSLAFVPIIFVVASRAWAADWLLEREGPRPWVRLLAWLAIPFATLTMGYVRHRAWGIADVGLPYLGASLLEPPPPLDLDAAAAYRRVAVMIQVEPKLQALDPSNDLFIDSLIEGHANFDPALITAYLQRNREPLELARKASSYPRGLFEDAGWTTIASGSGGMVKNLRIVGQLLGLDVRERIKQGDRPGAWISILALLRMSNQLGQSAPTLARAALSAQIHHKAIGLAFDWLAVPGLTLDETRKALGDLKGLPAPSDLTSSLMVEESILERSLDLSGEELAEALLPGLKLRKPTTSEVFWFTKMVAAPWERTRARRIARLMVAHELPLARLEPYLRGVVSWGRPGTLVPRADQWPASEPEPSDELLLGSWLARIMIPNFRSFLNQQDRVLVGRRALEQAVALEVWKLEHDGKFPETLDLLVPGLLARLPLDPYSGRPFGYLPSDGRPIRPPIAFENDASNRYVNTKPGQPLLYSVGPNRNDERGQSSMNLGPMSTGDDVYPIP